MLLAESRFNFSENGQVLNRLRSGVDHLTETTHLETFDGIFWEKLSLAGIALLEEFTDSHRLS